MSLVFALFGTALACAGVPLVWMAPSLPWALLAAWNVALAAFLAASMWIDWGRG